LCFIGDVYLTQDVFNMKLKISALVAILFLTGCSGWVKGNKILADKSLADQQIMANIIDNKTSIIEVEALFGDKKQQSRSTIIKSFPDGVYAISSYQGHLNDFGGTYAHRVLFVAYDKNGVVINHDLTINNFRQKNAFEEQPEKMRLAAFNEINKNDSDEKVLNLLGTPRALTFSDAGNVIWIYNYTEISRDASSYVPVYNMFNGTESGLSERVYVELKDKKVENIYLVSMNITQGRGVANADNYKEVITHIKRKYN
jgi:hypothetical protein